MEKTIVRLARDIFICELDLQMIIFKLNNIIDDLGCYNSERVAQVKMIKRKVNELITDCGEVRGGWEDAKD